LFPVVLCGIGRAVLRTALFSRELFPVVLCGIGRAVLRTALFRGGRGDLLAVYYSFPFMDFMTREAPHLEEPAAAEG
jgi:hypothetical protein